MLLLAFRDLIRRPLRNGLTIAGLASAVAVLACLKGFYDGYEEALKSELNRMGVQMMLVPLGCPYDAAAKVVKGKPLENTLPANALQAAKQDPAVEVAAPLLTVAVPSAAGGRVDMWVGVDESALKIKPWWKVSAGTRWFDGDDSVILGCDAAELEMRAPGDSFYSPETNQRFRVAGVLERSGTSDDSLFFVPLHVAQRMFKQPDRLTAVAIRLKDPALMREASQRLQQNPGAQVVTIAEMTGVLLNLISAAHRLLLSIGLIALTVSALSVFNTVLAGILERTQHLAVLRTIGASRLQIMWLVTLETLLLTTLGSVTGMALVLVLGSGMEDIIKRWVPLAPIEPLLHMSPAIALQSVLLGVAVGVLGGVYPAWRASRLEPAAVLKYD